MTEFDQLVNHRARVQESRTRAQLRAEAILARAKAQGRDQLDPAEDDDYRLFMDLMRYYGADLAQMDQSIRATLTEGVRA